MNFPCATTRQFQPERYGTPLASPNANGTPPASQVVTVGKRLTSRTFVSYEQGVAAATGVTKLTDKLTAQY